MEQKTIAVIGATGSQGKGVVHALVQEGSFRVRAITRNAPNYSGPAQEIIQADLTDPDSLKAAFHKAYGVFVVTNFWEGADELAQGKSAIQAAKAAGIQHFVWSTLPNVEVISKGAFNVPHFTGKANVDELVSGASFNHFTFVQAPFYFQNFTNMMTPQTKEDGTTGWTLPIDPAKKVIHMADINDLGKVVAGAFLKPEIAGNGNYLSLATELNSFDDIIDAYAANGKRYSISQVPSDLFSTFFEGAEEIAEMLGYFEAYSYMGPKSEAKIEQAKEVSIGSFTSLKEWIKQNT